MKHLTHPINDRKMLGNRIFVWFGRYLPSLLSPFILIGLWEAVAWSHAFPDNILIPPDEVLRTFIALVSDGELGDNLAASALRVVFGFSIGGTLGFSVGLAMGIYPALERYLGLFFTVVRQVPFIAWAPLMIVAFGIGETFKLIIIAYAAFFPVALSTLDGVRNVPRNLKDVATLFRFSRWALMRTLVLPAALPSILTGIRLALSRSWMIVVAAELFAASTGLGHMVGVVVIGVVGFTLDQLLRWVESRFSGWQAAER